VKSLGDGTIEACVRPMDLGAADNLEQIMVD
jgi:hypothetical protein